MTGVGKRVEIGSVVPDVGSALRYGVRYGVRTGPMWFKVLAVKQSKNGSVHLDCEFEPGQEAPIHKVELRFNKAGWAAALKTGLIEWRAP
jgi:hypothetical protein